MRKWKYHSLILRDLSIAESKLNVEGEKGWELVTVALIDSNTARAFFKMPIMEQETEPDPVVAEAVAMASSQSPFSE
jgi:hypothetical protein